MGRRELRKKLTKLNSKQPIAPIHVTLAPVEHILNMQPTQNLVQEETMDQEENITTTEHQGGEVPALTPDANKPGKITPEQIAREKLASITVANTIFKTLEPLKDVTEPEARHNIVIQKFHSFASAFPVITRLMCRELRYNETAFRRFLDRMWAEPGKGMEGVIEHQANYVRLLYIEEMKAKGRHVDRRVANELYRNEYDGMMKHLRKIRDEERKARNEFSEEATANLEKRRNEVLNFIRGVEPEEEVAPLSSIEKAMMRMDLGLPVKFTDFNLDDFGEDTAALAALCLNMHKYIRKVEQEKANKEAAAAGDGPATETNIIVPEDEANPYDGRDISDLRDTAAKLMESISLIDAKK